MPARWWIPGRMATWVAAPLLLGTAVALLAVAARHVRSEAPDSGSVHPLDASSQARPSNGRWWRSTRALLREGDVEGASRLIEEAIDRDGTSPALLTDLAAIHLEKGSREPESRARYAVEALDAALRATEQASDRPEPWFNLATAASRLGLREQAERAWTRHDALETNPLFKEEGRQRLAALRKQWTADDWPALRARILDPHAEAADPFLATAADGHRQATRELLEEELLPAWGRLVEQGDAAPAAVLLRRARRLASALTVATGDTLLSDAIDTIEDAGPRQSTLARAHVLFGEGRADYEATARERALAKFNEAGRIFHATGSPFAHWTLLETGVSLYQFARHDEAARVFQRVILRARAANLVSLRARAEWLLALSLTQTGKTDDALRAYTESMALFARTGEEAARAAVASAAANALRLIGEYNTGWAFLAEALEGLPYIRSPRRQHTVLLNSSLFAAEERQMRAALVFQDASVAAGDIRGTTNTIIEGLVRRAHLYTRVGQIDAAAADLAKARQLINRVTSPSVRRYVTAWVDRGQGDVDASRGLATALPFYERALEHFEAAEPGDVGRLYLATARLQASLGKTHDAERSLRRGLHVVGERQRGLIGPRLRFASAGDAWELARELAQLSMRSGGTPAQAFVTTEQVRASLDPGAAPASSFITRWRRFQPAMPTGTAIVAYLMLDDRLLIAAATAAGERWFEQRIDRRALERLVSRFRQRIESHDAVSHIEADGRALFDVLLRPALETLPDTRTLLLVPDDALTVVPFAALVDTRSGRFLVESHQVAIATSLTQAMASTARLQARHRSSGGKTLIVGYDRAPGLPILPDVRREVRDVADVYKNADILIGEDATFAALQRNLPGHHVLHFAGHARANPTFPFRSEIFLAADERHPTGGVSADTLSQLDLRHIDLAVLAACETAGGPVWQGAGIVSLARIFQQRGVASVVGALWRVEDDAARLLLVTFHRRHAAGADPAVALREAQLALSRSQDARLRHPRSWSGLVASSGLPSSPLE
jgi:CHAT domain-containing protein